MVLSRDEHGNWQGRERVVEEWIFGHGYFKDGWIDYMMFELANGWTIVFIYWRTGEK